MIIITHDVAWVKNHDKIVYNYVAAAMWSIFLTEWSLIMVTCALLQMRSLIVYGRMFIMIIQVRNYTCMIPVEANVFRVVLILHNMHTHFGY